MPYDRERMRAYQKERRAQSKLTAESPSGVNSTSGTPEWTDSSKPTSASITPSAAKPSSTAGRRKTGPSTGRPQATARSATQPDISDQEINQVVREVRHEMRRQYAVDWTDTIKALPDSVINELLNKMNSKRRGES